MNNNERPVDDNSTVSIQDNEKMKQVERKETKKQKKSGITIRELTIIGLLAGITIALGVSGYGIIPLGPLNVTTLHVPTLIGAIVEGPKVGAFVGFIFGCYSLWQNITAPNILSPLGFNVRKHGLKTGSLKVRTRITVVRVPAHPLFCVMEKMHHLL